MPLDTNQQQCRAEFYLCLAYAYLAPDSELAWDGFRNALASDLDELGEILGYGISENVADLRAAVATIPDQASLLQTYSALFVTPPRRVAINAGVYLDGALNGGSVLAMEDAYRNAGLERCEAFRDLSDHVATQLEFVASRYLVCQEIAIAEAEHFLAAFVARWLPAFTGDLEREGTQIDAVSNPWLPLARMLAAAVAQDARAAQQVGGEAHARQQAAITKARQDCARNGITEVDMALIARRLSEEGLAVEHLAIAPEQRDEERGWSRRVPPSPRRGSRLG